MHLNIYPSSQLITHSHCSERERGRGRDELRWWEQCHLSSFSHFSEIGVTNRRVPFVSRRIVTEFLSGLATLIRAEQEGLEIEQHLSWKGQCFNDTFTSVQNSRAHIKYTQTKYHSTLLWESKGHMISMGLTIYSSGAAPLNVNTLKNRNRSDV